MPFNCENCNSEVLTESNLTNVLCRSNSGFRRVTRSWCSGCLEDSSFYCEDCGNYFASADFCSEEVDMNIVCLSCFEDNYIVCTNCDEVVERNNARYNDNDEPYCYSCYEDISESSENIHDYSYKPAPIFYGGKGIVKYGVELELSTNQKNAYNVLEIFGGETKVYLKEDSSIYNGGFELVTHPHTLDAHRSLWANFLSDERTIKGLWKAKNNGMHVHIGRANISTLQIGKICSFINKQDNQVFIEHIAERECDEWARFESEKATVKSAYDSYERHVAVNTTPSRTIEIRIFRGTTDTDTFWKNMEFVDSLVTWTKEESIKELSITKFCEFVKKNKSRYSYLYNWLVQHKYVTGRKIKNRKSLAANVSNSSE